MAVQKYTINPLQAGQNRSVPMHKILNFTLRADIHCRKTDATAIGTTPNLRPGTCNSFAPDIVSATLTTLTLLLIVS